MISFFKTLKHTLWKATRKRDKRLAKARADRHKRLAAALETDKMRREVYARDKGKCRVCQTPVLLHSSDDFKVQHAHHVTYRSAGGPNVLDNLVSLCIHCHAAEHTHMLEITGNASATLTVVKWIDHEHSANIVTESPCPS